MENKKSSRYYKLVGEKIIPCDILEAFAERNKHIGKTTIGDIEVSTVFLELNHAFDSESEPVLFETMIFGGEHNEYQERYCTLKEAIEGHKRAVELILKRKVLTEKNNTNENT